MLNVVTLVSGPDALDDTTARTVRDALAEYGIQPGDPDWLAPGVACDIPFDGGAPPELQEVLQDVLGDAPVDVVVQTVAKRRKRLLVADMDSTIITVECIDELAAAIGRREDVSAVTAKAMAGDIAFEDALRERVALLADMPTKTLDDVFEQRVKLSPGARTLTRTMAAHGAFTALISGGFSFFTERVGHDAGFDWNRGNVLEMVDGRLSGRVVSPILGRDAKRAFLHRLAEDRDIALADAIAVGDGANDMDMIRDAGMGVAYRAKPIVAARARARIQHADLTALLYIQGYRRAEFVD